MNNHVILLSAAAVLLFSCSREAEQVILPGETITFTAAWAGSDETRTILQSDGTSVWWDAAEQINVFFSDKASGMFASTNTQPQAIVDFRGSLPIVVGSVETDNPAHAYWAVYPYNATNTCDGESVTLTVPSTQTAAEGTFADKMFPSIATSTNFYLAFYNVCGGVRFTVANEGIASVTFKANDGESLTGKVKVGFDVVPVVESVVEGNSEVVVNAPTGGFVPGKYYFVALIPQTLSKGVSLTFKKEDGKVASTSLDNSININRSRFGKMEEKDKGLEFKDDGSGHNPSDIIVFADSKVKERLVAKFDTDGDGELSYAEAAAVSSIEGALTIKTITSFDEFQYFTGVKTVPDEFFKDWTKLTSIVLPPSITCIGSSAFYGCSSLVSIAIREGVITIGKSTFEGCSSLVSIIIPEGVTSIEERTFYGCSSLTSIVIPESVMSIGKLGFCYCSSLASIVIPERLTSIGDQAFFDCSGFASIVVDSDNPVYDSRNNCNAIIKTNTNALLYGCMNTFIPESVTSIEHGAFYSCSGLVSIIIPESVTSIGSSAFYGCSSLVSIAIPEGVITIRSSTFKGCSSLVSVVIPEGVTSMENSVFEGCSSLASVVIPESVRSIGPSAFYGCSSLASIVIPEGVTSIGENTFSQCSSLVSIVIPESVTSIGKNAFLSCKSLVSIVIPESVMSMGSSVFSYCSSLASIVIPESVTTIEDRAFFGCSSLASVVIPESVTTIKEYAFKQCSSLVSIVIPEGVTSIKISAFESCTSLESITVLRVTPPSGASAMFSDTNNAPIYVPSGSVDEYKKADKWKNYASRIQAIQE